MMGYDAWLEAPYVDAARREADFERWAEQNLPDLDWDDNGAMGDAWDQFDQFLADQDEE